MTFKRNFVLGLISSSLFVGCGDDKSQSSEIKSEKAETKVPGDDEKKPEQKDKLNDSDCKEMSADEFLKILSANKKEHLKDSAGQHPDSCGFCKLSDEIDGQHPDSCGFCKLADGIDGQHPDSCGFCKLADEIDGQHPDSCGFCKLSDTVDVEAKSSTNDKNVKIENNVDDPKKCK